MSRQFQPVADTQVSKPLQVFSIFGFLLPRKKNKDAGIQTDKTKTMADKSLYALSDKHKITHFVDYN